MSYPGPPASSDFPWIDAGGPVPAADTYGTLLPASFRRRRGLLVRNPFGNRCPGVVFSPEGAFPQLVRTEPFSRRHFDAERPFSYGIPSKAFAAASFRRRRAHLVRNPVCSPLSGAVFSPERGFPPRCSLMGGTSPPPTLHPPRRKETVARAHLQVSGRGGSLCQGQAMR